jgi:DnaJ like chaperone protein
MGKILGLIFGLIFTGFSPIGAFLGFLLGAFFDSSSKIFKFGYFGGNSQTIPDDAVIDAFPILAAEIVSAGGIDRLSVLTVKNITVQIFGNSKAKIVMEKFKNYVENGYSKYQIDEVCNEISHNLDLNSRMNLINILFSIIKSRGIFSQSEVSALNYIADAIGISLNQYNNGYSNYEYQYQYNTGNYSHSEPQKDYYEVLSVSRNATDDEIKKQYRSLCKKYHPDKSSQLPEKERIENEKRIKEIIGAYEEIKKERGIK